MYIRLNKSNPAKGLFFDLYEINPTAQKTLYFIGPYKGAKYYFHLFFKAMTRQGYRVLFLQPHRDVLSTVNLEWLGESILEALEIIEVDRKARGDEQTFLAGVSLGSYLGINILLNQRFKKFVVIAGGVPLGEVFRTAFLFRKDLKNIEETGRQPDLDKHWLKFDKAFTNHQLSGVDMLLINSKNDRIISSENLTKFVDAVSKTGANVANNQTGMLPHTLKSLSLNLLAKKLDEFYRK